MSASNDKKNRMTERQLAAQREEKKVRIYTIAFVVVLVVLVAVAVYAGITQQISSRGLREKGTTAVTIGSHQLSNADLNYYFIDGVNNFYSQNGAYASLFGLDVSKPLDKQAFSEDGTTWADYFVNSAKETARSALAICDRAEAEGFTVSDDQAAQLDSVLQSIAIYASLNGFSDEESYLKAFYGNGATVDSFKEYYRRNILADAYQAQFMNSLNFTDADIRAHEAGQELNYNSYTYNQYYLVTSKYLEGGTVDADGNTVYSAEEKAAAARAAEADAKSVIADNIKTVEDMDKAINALSVNANTESASSAYTNTLYTSINSTVADWISDPARVAGDKVCIPSTSVSTDDNGNEVTDINGYYVVFFQSATDNKSPVVNVRHILVEFEADDDGEITAEAKAAAKESAESLLSQWKSGNATEESFAALATENTDDPGSQDNGGLYENVHQGQMVPAFNDWCFDASRKSGDTDIVETEYGYHVMYFVGNGALSYRDSMIVDELKDAAYEAWYTELVDSTTMTDGDTSYMRKDIILNSGNQ